VRHFEEFRGLYAALARSAYPLDVIEEPQVEEGLPERLRLLVLPGVGAMSDRIAGRIREFVARGGRVLATFDTSRFTEQGGARDDYALADVFGAGIAGAPQGPSALDYLAVVPGVEGLPDFGQDSLPCPEHWLYTRAQPGADVLVRYRERMPRRYANLPAVSPYAAVTRHRFGSGTAVLVAPAIGDCYCRWSFADHRRLLVALARDLARAPVTVSGAEGCVETALRCGADGSLVLHLVNWTGGPRPVERAVPLGPLGLAVALPDGFAVRAVRAACAGGAGLPRRGWLAERHAAHAARVRDRRHLRRADGAAEASPVEREFGNGWRAHAGVIER
jgi:hypothetical protein